MALAARASSAPCVRARRAVSAGSAAAGPRLRPSVFRAPRKDAMSVSTVAQAAAAVTSYTDLSDEERARVAESLGYKTIGKHLPDGISLTDIVKTMPPEVFEINEWRAWSAVLISIVSMSAALYMISIAPWYLLPLAWAFAGTAFTGWFVVGHDCGHRSFSKNKLMEDIVGTLMFAPLIYPFEPWRIKHNVHHAHTNKLVEDTAWHPVVEDKMADWSPVAKAFFKFFLGTPLKLWASVGHWAIWHFDLGLYSEKQKPRVIVSLLAVFGFMATAFPLIVANFGWVGLAKYWLMPWLGYHFWMSTFTVVHHTAPHIPFKPAEEWNAARAQLSGTVHCDFPAWVEFLTHDISWHVPHHVNTKIPWYNLRKATESLRKNWGEYMTECTFNWRMVKGIVTECHLYDPETNYKPFDFKKEEPLFSIQRKFLPNSM